MEENDETTNNTPLDENTPEQTSEEVTFNPDESEDSTTEATAADTPKPVKYTGRKAVKYRASECLNCGHPMELTDVYCSYCAQMNSTKKLTVGDFFEELFSSIINYDSRFRTSIKTLLLKPGVMSREFIQGKRMKYVNPFRFYLSISILFFVILGLIANFEDVNFNNPADAIEQGIDNGLANITVDGVKVANVAELDSILKANETDIVTLDSLIKQQYRKKKQLDSARTYADHYLPEVAYDTMSFFNAMYKRGKLYSEFNQQTGIKSPRRGLDSLNHENTTYHRWIYRKAIDAENLTQEGPGEILGYFLKQLPFVIFFFIPIFALFVWLVYIRRKYSYTDHMVFLFHTQTMFFVLYGIALLIDTIIEAFNPENESGIATGIATLVFLFYLYKAMRNFYKQGRIKTIVKFLILNSVFFILASFGAAVAFVISFATY